jgi:hypothetical protein
MQRIIKSILIIALIVLIIAFAWNGIRKNFFPEKEAERLIHKYYEAIIDEKYDKAYSYLYIYDREHIDKVGSISAGTSLTEEEAEQFYQQKIAYLMKHHDYRVKDYRISEVEYADGHTFWHHMEIEVEISGETQVMKEIVHFQNGGLMISEQGDPFAKYRDGRMKITIGDGE